MSMDKFMGILKQAGVGAFEAGNPVNVLFGVVETVQPLSVRVDQRFILTSEFLVVPESLVHYEIDLNHSHKYEDFDNDVPTTRTTDPALPVEPTVIRRGLEVGDKLLLLRMQGGQKYVILDRVVSE